MPSLLVAAVAACALGLPIRAQQQTPVFRERVDIVPIDFLAVAGGGKPVTDLTVKDLRLEVDGKMRDIRTFQFVRLAATTASAPLAAPALPPPFGSNSADRPGRSVIIVIDHENIRAADSKPAIGAVKSFVDRLTPLDRAAVVTLPNGRVEIDLTTNHERVKSALDRVVGRAVRRGGMWNISLNEALTVLAEVLDPDKVFTKELIDRECRFAPEESTCRTAVVQEALQYAREVERNSRATLMALTEFMNGLASVEAPTAILFLSGTLVSFPETVSYWEDAGRAAARGRVQMYVVQAHEPALDAAARDQPPTMGLDGDRRISGLRDLAGVTGGEFLRLAGTGVLPMARIADELSSHYVLGFEPRAGEQDGKPHKISLTTTRPGVSIRVRPSFITGDGDRKPEPVVLETLLRETTVRRELPLRVAPYVFRDVDPRQVKVVVALEPGEESATLTQAAFALIDIQGRSAAQWTEEGANVVLRPVVTAAAVPIGDYRLRVAATDVAGRRGTVDFEFRADLTQQPQVSFGSVMAGWLDRGAFRPSLLIDARQQSVTGYLEFYGSFPTGSELSARFELAVGPDAPVLASAAANIQGSSQVTRFIATGEVPLAGISAGDYLLQARLMVNGRPAGIARQSIRISR